MSMDFDLTVFVRFAQTASEEEPQTKSVLHVGTFTAVNMASRGGSTSSWEESRCALTTSKDER